MKNLLEFIRLFLQLFCQRSIFSPQRSARPRRPRPCSVSPAGANSAQRLRLQAGAHFLVSWKAPGPRPPEFGLLGAGQRTGLSMPPTWQVLRSRVHRLPVSPDKWRNHWPPLVPHAPETGRQAGTSLSHHCRPELTSDGQAPGQGAAAGLPGTRPRQPGWHLGGQL